MNPLTRILPAARARIEHLSRRDVVIMGASAIAMKVADVALDKLVVDPLLDRKMVETYRATPLSMARLATHGGPEQHAALEAWRLGLELPAFAARRATLTYPGPAGDQWVDWQGETASRLLWGGPQPRKVPMRERPDRAFSEWAERRVREWRDGPEPVLVRVVGDDIEQATGAVKDQDYSILALPLPGGSVLTVSASWPETPEGNPRRDPTRHSPGFGAARDPRRPVST